MFYFRCVHYRFKLNMGFYSTYFLGRVIGITLVLVEAEGYAAGQGYRGSALPPHS